ncbi:hypothetical protein [Streptomyces canus]|uniref:hypothetical protein n=1 Tax=Streptomyces canus TaxID=58343 RepID=UPI0037239027
MCGSGPRAHTGQLVDRARAQGAEIASGESSTTVRRPSGVRTQAIAVGIGVPATPAELRTPKGVSVRSWTSSVMLRASRFLLWG